MPISPKQFNNYNANPVKVATGFVLTVERMMLKSHGKEKKNEQQDTSIREELRGSLVFCIFKHYKIRVI